VFAMFWEWIKIPVMFGCHETIRTLSVRMSMFPGIGKSTNFIFKNLACFANQDFL